MGRYKKDRQIINYGIDKIRAIIEDNNSLPKLSSNSNYMLFNFNGIDLLMEKKPFLGEFFNNYIEIRFGLINIAFFVFGKKKKIRKIRKIKKQKEKEEIEEVEEKIIEIEEEIEEEIIEIEEEVEEEIIEIEEIDNNRHSFVEITGQGLTLFGVKFFKNLIDHFKIIHKKFVRIDLFCDINVNINYFHSIIHENEKKKISKIYYTAGAKEGENIETLNFGNKTNKNRWKFLRIYNKILDSKIKGKWKQYEQLGYGEYEDITRLELERRQETARFWNWSNLMDDNILFGAIVKHFFVLNYQFFSFIKFEDFLNKKTEIDKRKRLMIKDEKLQKELKKEKIINERGVCPFSANYSIEDGQKAFLGYYKKLRIVLSHKEILYLLENCNISLFGGSNEPLYQKEKKEK